MAMIVVVIFFVLLLGGSLNGLKSTEERVGACTTEHLSACFDKFRAIFNDSILAFPITASQIKRSCRLLTKANKCVTVWNERCFLKNIKPIKTGMIDAIIEMSNVLCRNQAGYQKYALCFHNVATKQCYAIFETARDFGNKIKNNVTITFFNEFCCFHQAYVKCQEESIHQQCGEDGFSMYTNHIEYLMSMILGSDCYSVDDTCLIGNEAVKQDGHQYSIEWLPKPPTNKTKLVNSIALTESTPNINVFITLLVFMFAIFI